MDQLLQELANKIKTADKQLIIGISGHGAAGKTTFASKLINLLDKNKINCLNTDPYIISSNLRKYAVINYTYQNEHHQSKMTACHPSAHHLASLERDIKMIKRGLNLYTIGTHYTKSELISPEKNITIVEGMSVAFIDPDLFDLKIYFYTDGETEITRRSTRDIEERGKKIATLKKNHEQRRIQYEVFMHPYSQKFDIVVKMMDDQTILEKADFDFPNRDA